MVPARALEVPETRSTNVLSFVQHEGVIFTLHICGLRIVVRETNRTQIRFHFRADSSLLSRPPHNMLFKGLLSHFAFSLFFVSSTSAADRWPAAWCDKECIEACLFAQGCINMELPCRCSSHFQTKLNKCKSDGCDENYANKNWDQT